MIRRELIERLRCTACGGHELALGAARRPALRCGACEASFPIVDGIVDMVSPRGAARPGEYRTDTVPDVVGGLVDFAAPVMSLAVWHCSPLRYMDAANRALGRANPGLFLEAPIGTGMVLHSALAPYHDVQVIGVDSSWKMLRKAQRRFRDDARVHLVRARLDELPVRTGTVDSLQSLHGLHGVTDRERVLTEFMRVTTPSANISGTALIRGQELVADVVLDRYERWGLLPMLRTAEFLITQMRACGLQDVRFETHGAVLFFAAQSAPQVSGARAR